MGLLDLCMVFGLDWISEFFPNMGCVVVYSSQGRFFLFYSPIWALLSQLPRRVFFCFVFAFRPKKVIFGQQK